MGHRFWISRTKAEHELDAQHLLEQLNWQVEEEIDTGFDEIQANRAILSAAVIERVQDSTNPDYKRCWPKLNKSMRTVSDRDPRAQILDRGQALLPRFFPSNH
jgi:hypothetical protein